MNKKIRDKFSLPVLLVILFFFLYRTDLFLRRRMEKQLTGAVSEVEEFIEPCWDKIALDHVMKLFIPEWQKKILDQENIIEKHKDEPDKVIKAYLTIAEIYEKREKYKEAEETCSRILKEYPLHPLRKKAYLRLASVYGKQKKMAKVREINELLIQEFPDDSEVVKIKLKNIEIYEQEGNYQKAIEGYKEFLAKYPKTKEKDYLAFKIGLLYRAVGRQDKAAEYYGGVVWSEDSIWADNARGELWFRTKAGKLNKKSIHACKVSVPPRIDGRLNDPVWEKSDKVTGFVDTWKNVPVSQHTIVSVLYDDENLYIAFNCLESRPLALVARSTTHDKGVWGDDCIEIFLDTNRDYRTYYHLLANPRGTRMEHDGKVKSGYSDWNPKWKAAIAISGNHWNVEICIPFQEFPVPTPCPGTVWGVNFNRARRAGKKEISSWSFVSGNHHRPERFGYLVFK